MVLEFVGEVIEWRGPAPFVFVPVPGELSADIKSISAQVTYGWGVIPAVIRIGNTELKTSLFPKNGGYLVPIKVAIQRAENIAVGDSVAVRVEIPFEPNF